MTDLETTINEYDEHLDRIIDGTIASFNETDKDIFLNKFREKFSELKIHAEK